MFDNDTSLLLVLIYSDGLDIHERSWEVYQPTTESKSIVVGPYSPPAGCKRIILFQGCYIYMGDTRGKFQLSLRGHFTPGTLLSSRNPAPRTLQLFVDWAENNLILALIWKEHWICRFRSIEDFFISHVVRAGHTIVSQNVHNSSCISDRHAHGNHQYSADL